MFRINRLTLRDWIHNIWLRWRFNYTREHQPYLLNNYSSKYKEGFELTFEDDFTEVSWGTGKRWGIGEPWGAFHPGWLNKYFGAPEHIPNTSYAKFMIKYEPKRFDLNGVEIEIPYMASWLNTKDTFTQQYGRFECRMTLPKEKGTWPAFWFWGPEWPPEVDIIEAYGKKTGENVVTQEINIHWRDKKDNHRQIHPWKVKIDDYDEFVEERFHEFAVEWTPTGMYFYTDGILIFEYTDRQVLNLMFNKDWVKPWLLVNHNIEKMIDGSEGADYYSEFRVDYVRAYKKI